MIYIDATQLAKFLKAGKPVTGIQRLTLNSLVGLHKLVGDERMRAMVFEFATGVFKALKLQEFFAGEVGQPIIFSSDDSILLMEWFWNQQVFDAGLAAGKAEGAKQYRLICDVIPVAAPQFVRPENTKAFRKNCNLAISRADVILTISDHSKQDILNHFPEAMQKPLHVLKLAHEFSLIENNGQISAVDRNTKIDRDSLRPEIVALQKQSFALMVGTLEERKNTLLAVKAWQGLTRKKVVNLPKLVLVGAFSAHSLPYTIELWLRLKLARNIIHIAKCTDHELAWAYQNCQFSLYISQYEGWGLPIGESLWFGKNVIALRNSSLEEVAGEVAHYAESGTTKDVSVAIENMISRRDSEAQNEKTFTPCTQINFCNELHHILIEIDLAI